MPELRYLKIRFNQKLHPASIPQFRGAVNALSGRESVLFHNHTDEGFRYAYPLIQYKVSRGNASIVCVHDGADAIHHLFRKSPVELLINGKRELYEVEDLYARKLNLQVWDTHFEYDILNWLPLNQENYPAYRKLTGIGERVEFLERILRSNLLAFATGVDWDVEKLIEVKITQITAEGSLPLKGVKMHTVTGKFSTNVSLPEGIGIGKGASVGFGTIRQSRRNKENQRRQHNYANA